MNENFSMDVSGIKSWRNWIKVAAFLVYLAGALFATITFSQHVSGQFPTQPLLYAMAFAGAWANFMSLVIMPLAKEFWVSGREMTAAAWVFWTIEFLMVVFNTLAAYGSVWAAWWTQFSPASPVIVIGIWGILFYLDPAAKAHQKQVNFFLDAQSAFLAKLQYSMDSDDVQKTLDKGALKAAQNFAEESLHVNLHNSRTRRTEDKQEQQNNTFPMMAYNQVAPAADKAVEANGGNTSRAADDSITDSGKPEQANFTQPRKKRGA